MKICIFGAGAIGGYMGAKLAQSGADVSLVARGPHLEAIKSKGLHLIENGKEVGRLEGYPGEDFFWGLLTVMFERAEIPLEKGS